MVAIMLSGGRGGEHSQDRVPEVGIVERADDGRVDGRVESSVEEHAQGTGIGSKERDRGDDSGGGEGEGGRDRWFVNVEEETRESKRAAWKVISSSTEKFLIFATVSG